ncbi:DUF2267 domain-containing protein [Streptomyces sp. NPDC013978]|uniref:DUF2267 domain-containing protein n=1 Tax=Streptomyces TaxID=1883 RepID=UPI003700044A
MFSLQEPCRHTVGMTFEQMLERVRYEGAYPTRARAEEAVRSVLTAFGRRLTGDERVELAARLPHEAARCFTAEIPDPEPVTGWGFVKDLASRTGGTAATTRWDTGTVLRIVAQLAGDDLLDRVLAQLPPGYALLFGRAELTQTPTAHLVGAGAPTGTTTL